MSLDLTTITNQIKIQDPQFLELQRAKRAAEDRLAVARGAADARAAQKALHEIEGIDRDIVTYYRQAARREKILNYLKTQTFINMDTMKELFHELSDLGISIERG